MSNPDDDIHWLALHRDQWQVLEDQGWEFSKPPESDMVGITMSRGIVSATFWVELGTVRSIHESLLLYCNTFASAVEEIER